MAKKPSAGALYENVAFDKRVEGNPDSPADYGNTVMDWAEQFVRRAAYVHLRGGESVMAGRLQGRHSQIIRVRADSGTKAITTDWRARDKRTGVAFNIRDITPSADRLWLDILVESGVAI
jgi:head-tail adaptor